MRRTISLMMIAAFIAAFVMTVGQERIAVIPEMETLYRGKRRFEQYEQ